MAEYYIDSLAGSNDLSGTSPDAPRENLDGMKILAGDTVYFRRGSEYRFSPLTFGGEKGKPIIYSAYGDGEPPCFYGSKNVSEPYMWREFQKNIWQLVSPPKSEVGNIVFDFGEECGELVMKAMSLDENGKWYYSDFGCGDKPSADASLLLFCEENPAVHYRDIELCLYGTRRLAGGSHVRFEGLHFLCSGACGYAETNCEDIAFSECLFEFIGGCMRDKSRGIRFGNGIELQSGGKDVKIENCGFYNIYDSCFTTQGDGEKCGGFENISVQNCTFSDYGTAAYEIRDKIGKNVSFEFNVCQGAGAGFSMLTDVSPRMSEIYPIPVGFHIFAWRINKKTDGGKIRIMSNIFRGLTAGGETLGSFISSDALSQIEKDF